LQACHDSHMSDDDGTRQKPPGGEDRFTMDPEKVIWELARQLVSNHAPMRSSAAPPRPPNDYPIPLRYAK
jgi:hypothetical protein